MNPFLAIVAKRRAVVGGGGGFTNHSPVTIDHTKVPSTQTDFPVLVSVTDNRFKNPIGGGHVESLNGYDIRPFSNSGLTTALSYELERFNALTGEVVMWVKIPTLSSTVDTVIHLGYGDVSLITNGSSTATWTNGFLGVYHLGDGTTLNVNSATGSNNGTNHGATAVTGKLQGGGGFVSGSLQYFELPSGASPVAAACTYSAWVNASSLPGSFNPVMVRTDGTIFSGIWVNSSAHLNPFFTTQTGADLAYATTGLATLATGTWYHVAATVDGVVGMVGYVNAIVDGGHVASGLLDANALVTRIGSDSAIPAYWNGSLDEVRIASVARSANWITTEYNNQNAPGTFVTLGTEV